MIGAKLGHFEIQAKIGEGGMGAVYRAKDLHLGRTVALKVLPPAMTAVPERKARFIQEAKAASSLQHPNIVTIYEIGAQDGVDFIAMELVEGRTLTDLIPRGKGMNSGEALRIAGQLADGLAKAHGASIIHRDLKPANVMVSAEGHAKILDFGLAKLLQPDPASPDDDTLTVWRPSKIGSGASRKPSRPARSGPSCWRLPPPGKRKNGACERRSRPTLPSGQRSSNWAACCAVATAPSKR
jgi:eukaryotic-like serine/threonine-protein kinase